MFPLPSASVTACIWTSSDGTLTVAVGPRGFTKDMFDTTMKSANLTAVSGVGESAYSLTLDVPTGMKGAAGIVVVKSGTYYTIQATHKTKTSDDLLKSITDLAKTAASKIQ